MAERYHRPLPPLTQKHIERFHSRVKRGLPDECWLWMRARFSDGYGAFKVKKQMCRASRIAYFIATGVDPADSLVCHTCDNPPCCNPAHLFLGSSSENILDAATKDRLNTASGDNHYTRRRPELMEARKGDAHWTHRNPDKTSKGEQNGCAKLTEQDVRDIRTTHAAGGISYGELARRYNLRASETVRMLCQRRTWKHVA